MTDATRLTAALAERYTIERELGSGGMATVYLAHDIKHDRRVAVKVLKPNLTVELGAERFLREISTTANLHHPHILPLYDSGDADGFLFYVMPWIDGESLRDRLDREKQLPVDTALQITREVSDALSYAHNRGVIHRDIKPENILLESGHAMVADFGIARAVSDVATIRITRSGMSVGTPMYTSPEQASGEMDLDGRSDLYALACVLYEMLAGQPPFTGVTAEALVRQHLTVDPRPVTNFRPAVPAPVVAALQRALAKNPADRFNPIAQFAEALSSDSREGSAPPPSTPAAATTKFIRGRRAMVLAAVLVLVGAGIAGWALSRNHGAGGRIQRIAVLPLANLMSDARQDYFVDGMHEELLNQLGHIQNLAVLSRTSVQRFRGSKQSAAEIASALGVDALVEGSVFRSGDSVRISAQLIQPRPEKSLWSASYDGSLGEALGLQRRVAEAIAGELRSTLSGASPGAATLRRIDPAAQDAYLLGRLQFRTRTLEGMDHAIDYLTKAIQLQPDLADAYGGLAEAEALRTAYRETEWSTEQVGAGRERAMAAASRAIQLDSAQAGALSTLGLLAELELDWDAAEARLRRAAALNPNYAQAWNWLGDVMGSRGRFQEAVEAHLRAQKLDPFAPVMNRDEGISLMAAGRFEEALGYLRRAVEIEPRVLYGSAKLIVCLVQLGRITEAAAEEEPVLARLGAPPATIQKFRETAVQGGWPGALTWLIGLTQRELPAAQGDPTIEVLAIPGLFLASALSYLGRTKEALDLMDNKYTGGTASGVYASEIRQDPWLMNLRGDPRLVAVLRRYHLER